MGVNPPIYYLEQTDITFTVAVSIILSGFSWQHCDLGASLLDELLQVNLPQLLRQLLQVLLHVLQKKITLLPTA